MTSSACTWRSRPPRVRCAPGEPTERERIVSVLPSNTETLCAIGACAKLVGVDDYSDFPAQVTKLPKVGGLYDPNVEKIVSLKPDLVIGVGGGAATITRRAVTTPRAVCTRTRPRRSRPPSPRSTNPCALTFEPGSGTRPSSCASRPSISSPAPA